MKAEKNKIRLTYPHDYQSEEDARILANWCDARDVDYNEIIAHLDTSALEFVGNGDWDYDFVGSPIAIKTLIESPDFPPLWISQWDVITEQWTSLL